MGFVKVREVDWNVWVEDVDRRGLGEMLMDRGFVRDGCDVE